MAMYGLGNGIFDSFYWAKVSARLPVPGETSENFLLVMCVHPRNYLKSILDQ